MSKKKNNDENDTKFKLFDNTTNEDLNLIPFRRQNIEKS